MPQKTEKENYSIEKKIKAEAIRLGFSLCGITTNEPLANFTRYEKWLKQKHHAGMTYLESERHRLYRQNPCLLFPQTQSIVSLGWAYPIRILKSRTEKANAHIASYATDIDYHLTLPEKIESLKQFIHQQLGKYVEINGYTDSAPILEREIAVRAGLGWIGKNSCVISPKIGSAFLLAELMINYPLVPDQPFQRDLCGNCNRCVEICPTQCIEKDRTINSNQCISYLTIEHKGSIPIPLRSSLGEWLFGCDLCQMVCPWNYRFASHEVEINKPDWSISQVEELLQLSQYDFQQRFYTSPMSRSKWIGLMRNALIWLGNNGDYSNLPALVHFQKDVQNEILLEAVQWAIKEITQKYSIV